MRQDMFLSLWLTLCVWMQVAQKLYEGVQLSDGKAAGLITYMRTDGLHVGITLAAWVFLCSALLLDIAFHNLPVPNGGWIRNSLLILNFFFMWSICNCISYLLWWSNVFSIKKNHICKLTCIHEPWVISKF